MSGTTLNLGALRQAVAGAADDATLRLRKADGSVTTAERGLGGRVVQFFNGRPRDQDAAIGRALFAGLRAEFGRDIAIAAFKMARGDTSPEGFADFGRGRPITARDVRLAEGFARSMASAARRDASLAAAQHFAAAGAGFAALAQRSGIDPGSLGAGQKELHDTLLRQHVALAEARLAEGDALPAEALSKIARRTLRYVAAIGPDAAAASLTGQRSVQEAGGAVLRGLQDDLRQPARLADALLSLHAAVNARLEDASLSNADDAGGAEDYLKAVDIATESLVAGLSPDEARGIFDAAMAPGGAGRAMAFSLTGLCMVRADRDGFGAVAPKQLTDLGVGLLRALGERGGLGREPAALQAAMAAGEDAGDRLSSRGARPRLTREELKGAELGSRADMHRMMSLIGRAATRLEARLTAEADARPAQQMQRRREAIATNVEAARGVVLSGPGFAAALQAALPDLPAAHPDALAAMRGVVMQEAMRLVRAMAPRDRPMPPLDAAGTQRLVQQACTLQSAALARIAARPPRDFAPIPPEAIPPALRPTMARVEAMTARRTEALLHANVNGPMAEQAVLREAAEDLRAMPNTDLLGHLRTLLSTEMLQLRLSLQTRDGSLAAESALADLNAWEGLVQAELAGRALQGIEEEAQVPPDGQRLGGTQAATLAAVELRSQKREMAAADDRFLATGIPTRPALPTPAERAVASARPGVPLEQVVRQLRDAPLTVNLPSSLFRPDGPWFTADGKLREGGAQLHNVYQRPIEEKGALYRERRQMIEQMQLPTLVRQDAVRLDPANHPVSAAVNAGRNVGGGAFSGMYGDSFIVLKQEVKETRATFTAGDSFRAYTAEITAENIAGFTQELAQRLAGGDPDQVSPPQRTALLARLDVIGQRLADAVGTRLGQGTAERVDLWIEQVLCAGMDDVGGTGKELLLNLAIKHFADRAAAEDNVASINRLDQMLAGMEPETLRGVAVAAGDSQRLNTLRGGYIEAQVFGGVDIARDVAEIHVNEDFVDAATERNIAAFAAAHGITLVTFSAEEQKAKRLTTDQTVEVNLSAEVVDSLGHDPFGSGFAEMRDSGRIAGMMDAYVAHESGFDPEGIHGRRHVARSVIIAEVLANVVREAGGQVNSELLLTAVGMHDAGRKANGKDVWEGASAALAVAELHRHRAFDDRQVEELVANLIDKNVGRQVSIEGALLKSADCLEIMRTTGRAEFDPGQLWFMRSDAHLGNDEYLVADQALRDGLIGEVAAFIEATELRTPSEAERGRLRNLQAALVEEKLAIATGTAPADARSLEEVQDELTRVGSALDAVQDQVQAEHRALNAGTTSQGILAAMQAELRGHPDRYPLLNRYLPA
jgi:hypothetical protein